MNKPILKVYAVLLPILIISLFLGVLAHHNISVNAQVDISSNREKVGPLRKKPISVLEADQALSQVAYSPNLPPDFILDVTPEIAGVCIPGEANYNITVVSLEGFTDPVTLFASGVPSGSTVSFSVNPVFPTGESLMTIGNTSVITPGSYELDVVGIAQTNTHTMTVGLNIFNVIPEAIVLIMPPNEAENVDLMPALEWMTASQGSVYKLEIATDQDFMNTFYNATVENTNHQINSALDPASTYYWHVRAGNACGDGDFSATYTFTTLTESTSVKIYLPFIQK